MEGKVGDSVDAFPEGLPLQYATSTRAGLTAGFGMGPGGPRRYGRQTTFPFLGRQNALRADSAFDLHTQPD
jgi:hypothetical protein